MAGAQPQARKPCVRGRQASELCQEGGPGPALLRVLADDQENDLSKYSRGREGPLSPWRRTPPILLRGAHVLTGGWAGGGGGDLHVCQGPAARPDLKCAQKVKPLPGELLERQVRKQPNTCQTLLG